MSLTLINFGRWGPGSWLLDAENYAVHGFLARRTHSWIALGNHHMLPILSRLCYSVNNKVYSGVCPQEEYLVIRWQHISTHPDRWQRRKKVGGGCGDSGSDGGSRRRRKKVVGGGGESGSDGGSRRRRKKVGSGGGWGKWERWWRSHSFSLILPVFSFWPWIFIARHFEGVYLFWSLLFYKLWVFRHKRCGISLCPGG